MDRWIVVALLATGKSVCIVRAGMLAGNQTEIRGKLIRFSKAFEIAYFRNQRKRRMRFNPDNRQKVAGGFRNLDGCAMFANIPSLIETAKRQNRNVFDTILTVLHSSAPVFEFGMG